MGSKSRKSLRILCLDKRIPRMSPCDTHGATEETDDAYRLQSGDRVSMPEQDEHACWAARVACASQSNTTLYSIALLVEKIIHLQLHKEQSVGFS